MAGAKGPPNGPLVSAIFVKVKVAAIASPLARKLRHRPIIAARAVSFNVISFSSPEVVDVGKLIGYAIA
jgi:hypothetical protein